MLQIDRITPAKDTSLALMLAAQQQGWQTDYIGIEDLWVDAGQPGCYASSVEVWDNPDKWFALQERRQVPLKEYDVIFIRIDPPVNNDYIYATQILDMAKSDGVLVVNSPAAIRDFNEKICATKFPQLMPRHLLSADIGQLIGFHNDNEATVFKPLDAMGGSGIFLVKKGDMNLRSVVEGLTGGGKHLAMAQEYIPDILKGGDNRVVMFEGEPYPKMLARLTSDGDFRANLAVSGNYLVKDLGEKEAAICEQVAPMMKEHDISFAGLDIIGGYLSEINLTCPTGLRQIAAHHNENPASFYISKIAARLR